MHIRHEKQQSVVPDVYHSIFKFCCRKIKTFNRKSGFHGLSTLNLSTLMWFSFSGSKVGWVNRSSRKTNFLSKKRVTSHWELSAITNFAENRLFSKIEFTRSKHAFRAGFSSVTFPYLQCGTLGFLRQILDDFAQIRVKMA